MGKGVINEVVGGMEIAAGAALMTAGIGGALGVSLIIQGAATEAAGIAQSLSLDRNPGVTTRAAAAPRRIIYGTQRVGGVVVYESTTGDHLQHFNQIVVLATHPCQSIDNLWLDGRQVIWPSGQTLMQACSGNGSHADPGTYIGPDGRHYSFGSEVYLQVHMGTENAATVNNYGINNSGWGDDQNWPANAYGGGCTWVYLRITHDTNTFPSYPEVRFTIRGKNDIYDPRTRANGYTSNWALCVADMIGRCPSDTRSPGKWSIGDVVHEDQLIAAANVCDQAVGNANGTENNFEFHYNYDTTLAPADAVDKAMQEHGRISNIGGEWFIWPAYWQGVSSAMDKSMLVDAVQWTPKRSIADLCNRVQGTYIAPNYPYNPLGNYYDANGWYDGQIQNNWQYGFQPTSFPPYACDELHGYGTGVDVYLTQDGGIYLPKTINLETCLSISQAQRIAKIVLLRNRQQGSGILRMNLSALQLQPCDVIQCNFPEIGWTNKVLEVTSVTLKYGSIGNSQSTKANGYYVEVGVQETDQSVYEWNPAVDGDELNAYDAPVFVANLDPPAPPTNLALEDDATTATTLQDGTTLPRLLVTWTPPLDSRVNNGGRIEVQYQLNTNAGQPQPLLLGPVINPGNGSYYSQWVDAGSVSGMATSMYVSGINTSQYQNIAVQVRSVRSNGATSDWVQVANHPLRIIRPRWPIGGPIGPILTYTDTGISFDLLEPAEAGAEKTTGKPIDILIDGATYGRPLLSRLNSGRPIIDFSEGIHANKTIDYIADGASRYAAAASGAYGTGTEIVSNTEFANGTTGYGPYQDSNGGGTTLSLVAVAGAPNSTGKVLNVAANNSQVGAVFPHGCGINYNMVANTSGQFQMGKFLPGHSYLCTLWANIPTNLAMVPAWDGPWTYSIVGGPTVYVSSVGQTCCAGTGTWQKYVIIMTAAVSGCTDFGYFVCYSTTGGVTGAAGWQLASLSVIDLHSQGNTLDYVANGLSSFAVSSIDGNRRAMIDFSQSHLNQGALSRKNQADYLGADLLNRPQDLHNLIIKPTFDDGTFGSWGIDRGDANVQPVTGQTFVQALQSTDRDCIEVGNVFPVSVGDRYYCRAWVNSQGTSYSCSIGLAFLDTNGNYVNWITGAYLPAGTGWTLVSGWLTIPPGVVKASPWLNIAGPFGSTGTALWAQLYIGKYQPGSDVTGQNTARDASYLNGVASNLISPISNLMPIEAGAERTTGKSLTVLSDRVASNLAYGNGATVESLRPAQAGADVTSYNNAGGVAGHIIIARAPGYNANPITGGSVVNDAASGASLGNVVTCTAGWTAGVAINAANGFSPVPYDVYVRIRSNGAGNYPTICYCGVYDNTAAGYPLPNTTIPVSTSYTEIYMGRMTLTAANINDSITTYFSQAGVTTQYYIDYIRFVPAALNNRNQVNGVTANPSLASAWADLPEMGSGNGAMNQNTRGCPCLIGITLAFYSESAGGYVTGVGYSFQPVEGPTQPTLTMTINGDGSGAAAYLTWARSGTAPNYTWTPTLHITGGTGYTTATMTISGGGTYPCTVAPPTPQANQAFSLRCLLDGAPVVGPVTLTTDASGRSSYCATQLLLIAPGSHSFQVQGQNTGTAVITSAVRSFQLIELG